MDFLRLICIAIVFGIAFSAEAQVFAPGEMSKAHANLTGLSSCAKCHSTENRIDRAKCLKCHATVAARIQKKKGFHGQNDVRTAPCDKCHKEHRGAEAELVPWQGGTKKKFDHSKTGWPLKGGHLKLECEVCHDKRLIKDEDVLSYLKAHGGARTQQGLSTRCDACHFDEHRGAVGKSCEKCHDETAFKPPIRFDHDKSWRLEGAHKKTDCDKCHAKTIDIHFDMAAFPKPKHSSYLLMKPLNHELCTDCHKDPHANRFGPDCLSCHTTDSWSVTSRIKDKLFHDKTAFPLKGRHRFVPCARCHPKDKLGKTLLRPIAHERCNSCHPSAHPDIPEAEMSREDCTSCHDNDGFKPSRFTLERHDKTKFPLTNAHAAVACPVCHLKKMGPPNPPPTASRDKGFLSSLVISSWRMRADTLPSDCAKCHASPHRNQFPEKECTDCHGKDTWKIPPSSSNHDTKTQFALRGKHRAVACEKCHAAKSDESGNYTIYRPLPHQDCNACHADVHYGQFEQGMPHRPCSACHDENGFTPTTFDHNDPKRSTFPLRGKHLKTDCTRCHPTVALSGEMRVTRYRPTMSDCDGCHEDVHEGAYADADALLHKTSRIRTRTAPLTSAEAYPWTVPTSWYRLPSAARTDCTSCHVETGWPNVTFDHRRTRFPLLGRHLRVGCAKCHNETTDTSGAVGNGCRECHADPHRARLGADCRRCHTEEGFNNTDKMRAEHNRTSFPLTGRHGALPCTECHQDARDIGFNRTPKDCVACHADDVPGPGQSKLDHRTVSQDCAACHTTVGFEIADYNGHDNCFPVGTFSRHGAVTCEKCHQGNLPSPGGNCEGSGFSCTQCHGCLTDTHRNVSGYECAERKCYECHRNP